MEGIDQAFQRKLFIVALDLVRFYRPEVPSFNELLVRWIRKRRRKMGQVVPDNMVVLWKEPIQSVGSHTIGKQPVGPFWVLEYVSKSNTCKDYEDSFAKYEKELKVPYYLIFYHDNNELSLYHHNGKKYVSVKPNDHGRYAIPELEMEVGLLDGWARFWFRNDLLLTPIELVRAREAATEEFNQAKERADEQQRRADAAKQRADELAKARDAIQRELAQLRARQTQSGKAAPGP